MNRLRARDLGLPFPGDTGTHNAITDVPGVLVGYTTIERDGDTLEVGQGPVHTGVTAILPRGRRETLTPIWAGQYSLNGNGELTGTHASAAQKFCYALSGRRDENHQRASATRTATSVPAQARRP